MERKDGISVIVCCYNSAGKITPTLNHIFAQRVSNNIDWEVILVDNNCSDNTIEIAGSIYTNCNNRAPFHVIKESRPGLMHARRKGIDSSNFEYILFVDDDNWIESDYVAKSYHLMKKFPNTAIIGGFGTAATENVPLWFSDYQHCFATGKQSSASGIVPYVYGAGMCLRHSSWSVLQQSGHKSLLVGRSGKSLTSGEDTEMCYSMRLLGFDIRYDESLRFKHDLPTDRLNWKYLRKLYFGFGSAKALLDIYTSTIDGRPIPKNGRFPFWFDRVFFLTVNLLPDVWLLLKSLFHEMESNDRLLSSIGKVGHILGILRVRSNYIELHQEVDRIQLLRPND